MGDFLRLVVNMWSSWKENAWVGQ